MSIIKKGLETLSNYLWDWARIAVALEKYQRYLEQL